MRSTLLAKQVASKLDSLIGGWENFHVHVATQGRAVTAVGKDDLTLLSTNLSHEETVDLPDFRASDETPEGTSEDVRAGQVGSVVFTGKAQPVGVNVDDNVVLINSMDKEPGPGRTRAFFGHSICRMGQPD